MSYPLARKFDAFKGIQHYVAFCSSHRVALIGACTQITQATAANARRPPSKWHTPHDHIITRT
eukprot:6182724-Pleurochrysis_carterae.AAC.4